MQEPVTRSGPHQTRAVAIALAARTGRKPRAIGRHVQAWAFAIGALVALDLAQGLVGPATGVAGGIGPQDVSWVDQFGTSGIDQGTAVALDATGAYVAGDTFGSFPGATSSGGSDVFAARVGTNGDVAWVRQFGTSSFEQATGIAADGTAIYVVGTTSGALPGQTQVGGTDAFLRRYDHDGNTVWTRQFGTTASDTATAVGVSATGVYVAGYTSGALPGQVQVGGFDAFIARYDANGSAGWTRQFGTPGSDAGYGIAVDVSGVYTTGTTTGTFVGERNAGGQDAFVRRLDFEGNELWTREFGTPGFDYPRGVAVDATPGFEGTYVVGGTFGTFPGWSNAGSQDVFAAMYDRGGHSVWVREFGSAAADQALGVGTTFSDVYLIGLTNGAILGADSVGLRDAFLVKLALGPLEKISLVVGEVARLMANGTLNRGQGNSLTVKLEAAAARLERGNPDTAINILHAFQNEIAAFTASGRLSADEGGLLTAWADNLIDQIAFCKS